MSLTEKTLKGRVTQMTSFVFVDGFWNSMRSFCIFAVRKFLNSVKLRFFLLIFYLILGSRHTKKLCEIPVTWINVCSNLLLRIIFNQAQINIKQDQYQYQAQINTLYRYYTNDLLFLYVIKLLILFLRKRIPVFSSFRIGKGIT
jgi:hypothetical protein